MATEPISDGKFNSTVTEATRVWPAHVAHELSSILALNAGSSSLRYALFDARARLVRNTGGRLDLSSLESPCLAIDGVIDRGSTHSNSRPGSSPGASQSAAARFVDWLEALPEFASVDAVGHRIVHGMQRSAPEIVTPALITDLRRSLPLDPEHLPMEIELMERITERRPAMLQVACFDTAFHRSMPRVASVVPIPRCYEAAGVRRYGFHGLSYEFLMQELGRLDVRAAKCGRVILAHLGSGASLAAVRDGRCIDTSMGFTPASGLVMGTRAGDVDPGVIAYLSRLEGMSPGQFETMTNHASGLLGISEISADMRELLIHEAMDTRAAEAVAVFCYQTRKWIGSFAAALGGLDALVFTGGIGENLPLIRQRICEHLSFLGILLSEAHNAASSHRISPDEARVGVYVIRTDEELVIAQAVLRTIAVKQPGDEASQTNFVTTGQRAT